MSLPERIPCRCGDLIGNLLLKAALVEWKDESGKVLFSLDGNSSLL